MSVSGDDEKNKQEFEKRKAELLTDSKGLIDFLDQNIKTLAESTEEMIAVDHSDLQGAEQEKQLNPLEIITKLKLEFERVYKEKLNLSNEESLRALTEELERVQLEAFNYHEAWLKKSYNKLQVSFDENIIILEKRVKDMASDKTGLQVEQALKEMKVLKAYCEKFYKEKTEQFTIESTKDLVNELEVFEEKARRIMVSAQFISEPIVNLAPVDDKGSLEARRKQLEEDGEGLKGFIKEKINLLRKMAETPIVLDAAVAQANIRTKQLARALGALEKLKSDFEVFYQRKLEQSNVDALEDLETMIPIFDEATKRIYEKQLEQEKALNLSFQVDGLQEQIRDLNAKLAKVEALKVLGGASVKEDNDAKISAQTIEIEKLTDELKKAKILRLKMQEELSKVRSLSEVNNKDFRQVNEEQLAEIERLKKQSAEKAAEFNALKKSLKQLNDKMASKATALEAELRIKAESIIQGKMEADEAVAKLRLQYEKLQIEYKKFKEEVTEPRHPNLADLMKLEGDEKQKDDMEKQAEAREADLTRLREELQVQKNATETAQKKLEAQKVEFDAALTALNKAHRQKVGNEAARKALEQQLLKTQQKAKKDSLDYNALARERKKLAEDIRRLREQMRKSDKNKQFQINNLNRQLALLKAKAKKLALLRNRLNNKNIRTKDTRKRAKVKKISRLPIHTKLKLPKLVVLPVVPPPGPLKVPAALVPTIPTFIMAAKKPVKLSPRAQPKVATAMDPLPAITIGTSHPVIHIPIKPTIPGGSFGTVAQKMHAKGITSFSGDNEWRQLVEWSQDHINTHSGLSSAKKAIEVAEETFQPTVFKNCRVVLPEMNKTLKNPTPITDVSKTTYFEIQRMKSPKTISASTNTTTYGTTVSPKVEFEKLATIKRVEGLKNERSVDIISEKTDPEVDDLFLMFEEAQKAAKLYKKNTILLSNYETIPGKALLVTYMAEKMGLKIEYPKGSPAKHAIAHFKQIYQDKHKIEYTVETDPALQEKLTLFKGKLEVWARPGGLS